MLENKLEQLTNYMIRPRRRGYQVKDLGPQTFLSSEGDRWTRTDLQVDFRYGRTYTESTHSPSDPHPGAALKIHCSIFIPEQHSHPAPQPHICMVGLHGNTGSKISSLSLLEPAIKFNLALVVFDFIGCGNSQGEHVTLGYYEKYQIAAVLQYIHRQFQYSRFLLYGRSMGAASSLFYCCQVYPHYAGNQARAAHEYWASITNTHSGSKQQAFEDVVGKINEGYFGYEVVGLIVDSPYYEARGLFMGIAQARLWFLPRLLVEWVLTGVDARCRDRCQYMSQWTRGHQHKQQSEGNIEEDNQPTSHSFSPLSSVTLPDPPILPFPVYHLYGSTDDVISYTQTLQLFTRLQCDHKKLHILEGEGHGGHREEEVKNMAVQWVLGWGHGSRGAKDEQGKKGWKESQCGWKEDEEEEGGKGRKQCRVTTPEKRQSCDKWNVNESATEATGGSMAELPLPTRHYDNPYNIKHKGSTSMRQQKQEQQQEHAEMDPQQLLLTLPRLHPYRNMKSPPLHTPN